MASIFEMDDIEQCERDLERCLELREKNSDGSSGEKTPEFAEECQESDEETGQIMISKPRFMIQRRILSNLGPDNI